MEFAAKGGRFRAKGAQVPRKAAFRQLRVRVNLCAMSDRPPLEVGSTTPRNWRCVKKSDDGGGTCGSRRGLNEATSNGGERVQLEVGSQTPRG